MIFFASLSSKLVSSYLNPKNLNFNFRLLRKFLFMFITFSSLNNAF